MSAAIPTGNAAPELTSVQIFLPDRGVQFNNFLSYEYTEDFLSPSDSGRFKVDEDELTDSDKRALIPGARIEIAIGGNRQTSGFIDEVRASGSRSAGSIIDVGFRDWLSPAVDGHVDPKTRFTQTMTLLDVISTVLGPFGVQVLAMDNNANANAITGRKLGPVSRAVVLFAETTGLPALPGFSGPIPKEAPGFSGPSLSTYVLVPRTVAVQTWTTIPLVNGGPVKPQPNEGAFAFCSRIAQRFGLWIWPSTTPGIAILGKPDFAQQARYAIRRKTDVATFTGDVNTDVFGAGALLNSPVSGSNNVIDGDVRRSRMDQPTIMLASGFGGGGEFAKSKLRGAIINPLIAGAAALAAPVIAKYPGVRPVTPDLVGTGAPVAPIFTDPCARPVFFYDPESHTQAQLDAYLRRELSLRMRKALSATYTVEGHTLNGQPIAVNTIVSVDDDRTNVHQPLWILGRHFTKSATGGTLTTFEAILPGTLAF